MLTTERLLLRPWAESDAADLFVCARDPQVGPIAGWPPHRSVEESLSVIRTALSGAQCYAICQKADGRPIGAAELMLCTHTKLTDRADECELGYWLGKPYWGNGYMTEAVRALLRHGFASLGMRAVWGGYYDGNGRSQRVLEKCGFLPCRTDPDTAVPMLNEVRTAHILRLTRERWETDCAARCK